MEVPWEHMLHSLHCCIFLAPQTVPGTQWREGLTQKASLLEFSVTGVHTHSQAVGRQAGQLDAECPALPLHPGFPGALAHPWLLGLPASCHDQPQPMAQPVPEATGLPLGPSAPTMRTPLCVAFLNSKPVPTQPNSGSALASCAPQLNECWCLA